MNSSPDAETLKESSWDLTNLRKLLVAFASSNITVDLILNLP